MWPRLAPLGPLRRPPAPDGTQAVCFPELGGVTLVLPRSCLEMLVLWVWGGAGESEFLTSPQVRPELLDPSLAPGRKA